MAWYRLSTHSRRWGWSGKTVRKVRGDLLRAPPGLELGLLWEYDLAQLHVAA
jgi:hypothetical protein